MSACLVEALHIPRAVQSPLQLAWLEFLGRYHFDWFATFTFRFDTHPEAAYKRFRYWVHVFNQELHGRRYAKHGLGMHWCNALEYQRRGVVHFHAMLGDTQSLENQTYKRVWKAFWYELAGFCDIGRIEDQVNVTAYVSKYVVKGGELELSANLATYCQQQSLVAPHR